MQEKISNIDKTIPSKRWIHIIPPTILVYIVAFMDRTNISFAMAGGMSKDLAMTSSIAGLAAGIFFVGYLFLQVPGGEIAEKGNAKKFIACSIMVWGGLAVVCGFVQNVTELLIIRFLLGVAEGGVWPAILTIISHWFPNEERGRANAYFIMNVPIASIITGPLSGWIITMYNWRAVFIAEGIISIALIFVWMPLISNRPEDAKWISKEEKEYIIQKIKDEQKSIKNKEKTSVSLKDIFLNINMWKLILIYFCYQTGIYGFSLWLPTSIKNSNCFTSTEIEPAKIPMVARNSEDAIRIATKLCNGIKKKYHKIVWIKNTMQLEEIWISEPLLDEVKMNPNLDILTKPKEIEFQNGEPIGMW